MDRAVMDGGHPGVGECNQQHHRCIVLDHRREGCPELLGRGLARRGFEVRTVSAAADVLLELANDNVAVVVVCEPRCLKALPELFAAIQRYYPSAACWKYEVGDEPGRVELSRLESPSPGCEERVSQADPPGLAQENKLASDLSRDEGATGGMRFPRRLKLGQEGGDAPWGGGGGVGHTPTPLVTREELSMLLGPLFNHPSPDQAGGRTERESERE